MFRKLYWVTELVHSNGSSQVLGVFTSIPDLIRHGLVLDGRGRLRLTLTKLDSEDGPLGVWLEPRFEGIESRLQDFVKTDEFTPTHCSALVSALKRSERAVA
jgi:hypothetical protein